MTLRAGLLNDFLRTRLIAPEQQLRGQHQSKQDDNRASGEHPSSQLHVITPFTFDNLV
jgi:hypothetical protein